MCASPHKSDFRWSYFKWHTWQMLQQSQYICMISILNLCLCLCTHTSVCVDADAHTPWRTCEGQRIASGISTPYSHLVWDRIYYPTFLSPRLAVPELPRVFCLPPPPRVLIVGTLGLQSHDTTPSFTRVLGIRTQVLMRFTIKPSSQPHKTDF